MISKASVQFVHISPRKTRYVIDLLRGKTVLQAYAILSGTPRRAGEIIGKLLKQAVDAADKNSRVKADRLRITKILADGGPSMRRIRPASMGRASVIRKRTSHIIIELDEIPGQPERPAAPKTAAKEKAQPATAKTSAKGAKKKMVGAK